MLDTRRRRQESGRGLGIRETIKWAFNSNASDPRDSIYGTLGLSDIGIVPNYSHSRNQIYCDFFARWLEDQQNLEILCYSGIGVFLSDSINQLEPMLPSFIPNWEYIRYVQNVTYCWFLPSLHGPEFTREQQCGLERVATSFDGKRLIVSGLVLDTVSYSERGDKARCCFDYVESCLRLLERERNRACGSVLRVPPLQAMFRFVLETGGEDILYDQHSENFKCSVDAFLNVLIDHRAGHPDSKHITDRKLAIASVFQALGIRDDEERFWVDMQTHFFGTQLPLLEPPWPMSAFTYTGWTGLGLHTEKNVYSAYKGEFSLSTWKTFRRRTIIRSSEGFIGLGPLLAREGDIIATLPGLDYPVVLRRQEDHYVQVGVCYLLEVHPAGLLAQMVGPLQQFEIH